jgi:hypothetical protein
MITQLNDPDKITLTYRTIIPTFIRRALNALRNAEAQPA